MPKKPVSAVVSEMHEIAKQSRNANRSDDIGVVFMPVDIKAIGEWDRFSARREIDVVKELKNTNVPFVRNGDAITVYAEAKVEVISFKEARKMVEDEKADFQIG